MPIFHVIIYMVEMGLSVDEIVTDLKSQVIIKSKGDVSVLIPEYMRLTYPLYAIKEIEVSVVYSMDQNTFPYLKSLRMISSQE